MRVVRVVAYGSWSLVVAGCWLTSSFDSLGVPSGGDASADGAGPVVSCLLCDDFEHDGGFDLRVWPKPDNDQVNAQLTIDAERVHDGHYALRAQTSTSDTATRAEGFLIRHFASPLPSEFYGRVWIFLPAAQPSTAPEFLGFQGAQGAGDGLGLAFPDGKLRAFVYSEKPGITALADSVFPVEQWTCLRFRVEGAGRAPSRFTAFVGDRQVLEARSSLGFPPYVEFYIGMRLDPGVRSRVWDIGFDDLALAPTPVPCD